MKSHREPQVASAPQGQAEKQTNHHHRQQARPLFAGVLQVHQSKRARKQHGGWPETNRPRQRKLRVTAQQEFFKKSHHQEKHSPEQGEAQHPAAVNRKMPKLEAVKAEQKRQQQRDARQPPQRANPEQSTEGPPRRQAIRAPRTPLHSHQQQRRENRRAQQPEFFQHHRPQALGSQLQRTDPAAHDELQRIEKGEVER